MYVSETEDMFGVARRPATEPGAENCLPGLKPGGRDAQGNRGAEEDRGKDGREVHRGLPRPNVPIESLWKSDT